MQDQIKNLPKKYFQITDENKRDRMVAYVRLDEVLGIVKPKDENFECPNCGLEVITRYHHEDFIKNI